MKLRNYIITYRLHCGAGEQADMARKLFVALHNRLHTLVPPPGGSLSRELEPSGVKYSYFARYTKADGSPPEVCISLALHALKNSGLKMVVDTARRVYCSVVLVGCGLKWPAGIEFDVKVERRGELSPLHSAIMPVALLPEAKDPQKLADAFHWCLNASGYHYLDEAMIASGMAFNANRSAHPSPETAPLPYGFFKAQP